MVSELTLVALARRYQLIVSALAERSRGQVGLLWDRFGGLDDEAASEFATRASTFVTAAQRQSAGVTVSYVNSYVTAATSESFAALLDLDAIVAAARGGVVSPLDIYMRPIITARKVIADGNTFTQAMKIGRARATSTADTDVMLSSRLAATDTMKAAGRRVAGYRRLPNAKACALCLTASTQRYHVENLLPIHANCACSVVPIVGSKDPGHIIDHDRLAQLKAGSDRPDYWNDPKAAIAVHQHGELGPVLTHAGDHFDHLAA